MREHFATSLTSPERTQLCAARGVVTPINTPEEQKASTIGPILKENKYDHFGKVYNIKERSNKLKNKIKFDVATIAAFHCSLVFFGGASQVIFLA